jgi:L-lactate dehydrogenase complex protein LldG
MNHLPGSIVGKEEFIGRLAKKLGRSKPMLEAPSRSVRGVPEFYAERHLDKQEMLALFVHNWTTLTGKVLIVKEEEAGLAAGAYLRQICTEHGVDKVVRWEHEGLNEFGLDAQLQEDGVRIFPWKETLGDSSTENQTNTNWSKRSALLQHAEQCRIGVVWADYAIAETGTVVLCAKGGQGRSVSLLPDILLAVFRSDQLVRRMGEAFSAIAEDGKYADLLPSSLNLITGPSRSADIENDLTIGIHGPGKVYAIIIE